MIDWAAVGAVATGAGALATGASMTLIAWQAWETRRTADAARHGLGVAEASLLVSQSLAIEAVRTRLDARAPRLRVVAAPTDTERARQQALTSHGEVGPDWPHDRQFRRNEDDDQYLTLGCQFAVMNEGDIAAEVWVEGPINLMWPAATPARTGSGRLIVRLAPNDACRFRLEERRPLSHWADAWADRANGDSPPSIRGEVICSDAYDEGVVDRWTIEAYCNPVQPKPGDDAAWTLRQPTSDSPIVTAATGRQRRTYYLSKEQNLLLEPAVPA